MSAKILSGRDLAAQVRNEAKKDAHTLKAKGINPAIAIVVATADESAHYYVRHIVKAAKTVDIEAGVTELSPAASEAEIAEVLNRLAVDKTVHGIILQTPLPAGVNADSLRILIPPHKDVDGANPISAGRLLSGLEAFAPSTAAAVMHMLKHYKIPLRGTPTVIVGRSLVVGKPLMQLLLAADATVTVCHSKTRDLASVTRQADILVVAIGRPAFIGAEHVKPGSVVIDVGTNVTNDGTLVGDVDSHAIESAAGAVSPVPGGVGPVTTALLLKQTVAAAAGLV